MQYIGAGPLVSIRATLLLVLLLAAAWQFGRAALSFFSIPGMTRDEKVLFEVGLGLLAVSLGIFLLGILGFLTRPAFGILFAALFFTPYFIPPAQEISIPEKQALSIREKIIGVSLVVIFFLAFIQALAPCTGVDALAYHLYLPKEFLKAGRMLFWPIARESLWPFNTEMFFMAGLLFQGTATAQLFHWIFYPLTAIAIYLCAKRYYGPKTALWAACIFVFMPAAFAQSGYPYVDLSLAFFIFTAVYAVLIAGESNRVAAYVLAGIFCGGAMGVKFFGLGALLILFPMTLLQARFDLKRSVSFLAGAVLVGGGWYLRSWMLAGNPVYPLFHHLFGSHGWAIQMNEGVGMGKGPVDFLFFSWNIAMYPNAFGGQMIGVLYLVLMPAIFLEWRRPRSVSMRLAVFGLGYTAFLFTQSQHARFFISAAPFWAIGAAVAFSRTESAGQKLRYVSRFVIAAILTLHACIFVYRLRDVWPVVSGNVDARSWLLRHERSFQGFDYIQKNSVAGEKILNAAEVRFFYSPDDLKVEHFAQTTVRLQKENISLERYMEEGYFDYIWLAADPPILAISDYLKKNKYVPVLEYDFTEKPTTFHYTIYRRPQGSF